MSPNICEKLTCWTPTHELIQTPSSTDSPVTLRVEIFPSLRPLCFFFLGEDCGVLWGCGMLLEILYAIGNILLEIPYWKYPIEVDLYFICAILCLSKMISCSTSTSQPKFASPTGIISVLSPHMKRGASGDLRENTRIIASTIFDGQNLGCCIAYPP